MAANPPTAQDFVTGIKGITQHMQALQAPAQSITIVNAPLVIVGQGPIPQLTSGFASVIATTSAQAAALSKTKDQFESNDADAIYNAIREYTRVSQVLFSILIAKADLFYSAPYIGAPVAGSLKAQDAADDALIELLIEKSPSSAKDIKAQFDMLNETEQAVIKKYEGLGTS